MLFCVDFAEYFDQLRALQVIQLAVTVAKVESNYRLQNPCTRIHGSGGAIDVVDLE